MNKVGIDKIDLLLFGFLFILLFISFFATGYYNSWEILMIREIWWSNLTNLYSLILIPIIIICIILSRFKLSIILNYVLILFQFNFFRLLDHSFEFRFLITLIYTIGFIIYLVVIAYLLNRMDLIDKTNQILSRPKLIYISSLIIVIFLCEYDSIASEISELIIGFILGFYILYLIQIKKNFNRLFIIFALVSLLTATYTLSCYNYYSDLVADIVLCNYSIRNILNNCLVNYLWVAASYILLYICMRKVKHPGITNLQTLISNRQSK